MKEIKLTKGKSVIVDDADYDFLMQWKWCFCISRGERGYAFRSDWRSGNPKSILMHRIIMNPADNLLVDHIDMNTLNNQRSNLRICTRSQNLMNRNAIENGTSKYKGVTWDRARNKWMSHIVLNKKFKNLGRFEKETDAAHVYNIAALSHFGEFARINIII